MKIIGSEFIKSQRRKCIYEQDVVSLKRQGFTEATRKSNFVYMVKPVKAYVTIITDGGVIIKQDMREQILRYYGMQSLKLERFQKFLSDVYIGKIKLCVNYNGEIVVS